MSVTDELNAWIREHGNERDALNVALGRLRLAQVENARLREQVAQLRILRKICQDARDALQSLDEDALGIAETPMSAPDGETAMLRWPIRDELMDNLNKAFAATEDE